MKNILKKLILILIAFLMLFSIVGQFLVSANETDQLDNDYISELNDKDQSRVTENPIINDLNNLDKEEVNEELNRNVEEKQSETETESEDDNLEVENNPDPLVQPYDVKSFQIDNSIQTFKSTNTLHNPTLPDLKYQLVTISDSGKINPVSYFTSFKAAHVEMLKLSNGAIRHKNSHSPMKFVAATRAILHTVPHRNNGVATMYINDINKSGTSTYISRGYEMAYFGTVEFDPNNGNGIVHTGINGFYGTTELKQVDVIPMTYVENGITVSLGGSNESGSSFLNTPRINSRPAQSYYKVTKGPNNMKTISYFSENLNREIGKPDKVYWKFVGTLGISDEEWMKENNIYYSWDGVNFYNDRDYKSFAGTYYNYYQYLPLRSKSNVTAKELDDYLNGLSKEDPLMKNLGNDFVVNGQQYGINPLLVYAMGAHESNWGTSKIAREKLNLFGWNAVDSAPADQATKFESLKEVVKSHMSKHLRGYLDVTYVRGNYKKDYRYNGGHLGNKGSGFNMKYASDPFWGMKISAIAYNIDASVGLKDFKKEEIGLVLDKNEYLAKRLNVTNTNENTNASISDVLYNFKSSTGYMGKVSTLIDKNFENNTFYKTQSFAGMNSSGEIISFTKDTDPFDYDWQRSIGYIKKNAIIKLDKNDEYFKKDTGFKPNPKLNNDIPLKVIPTPKPDPNPEPTPEPKPDPKPEQFILGDVNGDKVIDIFDYVAVANHILKRNILSEKQIKSADINKDGVVDIFDYVAIANHILGKTIISGGN